MIKPSRSSASMEALERRQMLSITGYDVQFIGYPNANTTGWSSSSQDPMGAYCLGPFGNQSVTYGSNGWAPHVELQISTGIRDDWIRPQSSSDRDDKVEILVDGLLLLTRWYQKDGNPNGWVFLSQELGPDVQDSGNGYWTIPHTGSSVALTYTGSGLDTGSGDKMDITHLNIHITPPPTVSVTAPDNVATEDSTLDPTMTFRFQRTGNLSQSLTANYQLGGTAGLTQTGTVTFAANAATVDLLIFGGSDTTPEWTETVTATVTDSSNGQYVPAEGSAAIALAEIVDNDLFIGDLPGLIVANNDDDNANDLPDDEESGPISGEDDLYALTLTVPQDVKPGATVTLTAPNDKVRVWLNADKSGTALNRKRDIQNKPCSLVAEPKKGHSE